MEQQFYFRKQVIEVFNFDESFLVQLEEEKLVAPVVLESSGERVFPAEEVERLRIICNLMRELDVNLAGVEVILSMRDNMIMMQRQFQQILESLVKELKLRMPE